MIILSLGSDIVGYSCAIADSLKEFIYGLKREKNYFDYFQLRFYVITEILNGEKLDFMKSIKYRYKPNNYNLVEFPQFEFLFSFHDIQKVGDEDKKRCTLMYQERFNRFYNSIINEDKIIFIRFAKLPSNINDKEVDKFLKKVCSINKKNAIIHFVLITMSDLFYEISYYKNPPKNCVITIININKQIAIENMNSQTYSDIIWSYQDVIKHIYNNLLDDEEKKKIIPSWKMNKEQMFLWNEQKEEKKNI